MDDLKHVEPKIIWSLALIRCSSCVWWRIGDRQKILNLIRHRRFNSAVGNCSIRPKGGLHGLLFSSASIKNSRGGTLWFLVCYLQILRQFTAQMFNQTWYCVQLEWPLAKVCKMPNMLNAAAKSVPVHGNQHSEQLCKVAEAATAEASFSFRSLPDKCFTVPQILSQPNGGVHQLLCWIFIHLCGWFPPWSLLSRTGRVGVSFFLPFLFSTTVCLHCRLVWKESSQSVIERWVKWSTAERFLGSLAWWGEVGHRCQFLHRQADALHTRDAFLSISPSNQCNLCLVICCTVIPTGEKETQQKKAREWGGEK